MSDLLVFLAVYAIYGVFLAPLLLVVKGQTLLAVKAWLAAGLAWAIGKFIQDFFYFPRPYIVAQHPTLVKAILNGSFPSVHTAMAMAISFVIFWHHKRLGVVLLIVSLLIGVGRIGVLVHSPLDVAGGIVLGYLAAWALDNYHSKY